MVCSAAWDTLVSVVLTAKVSMSGMSAVHANVGDTMTLSFVADSAWVEREIVGQGIVYDGIGPFGLCDEHFSLSFSSGMHAHLTPPAPVVETGPIDKDAVAEGVSLGLPKGAPPFWFSLLKSRPVLDGAFVSTLADKGSAGVPLSIYGASAAAIYTGIFDIKFKRDTIPAITLKDAFGTYKKDALQSAEIRIARDWASNTVLSATFESLTIGPAKE
jgi:hypothetical protein